MPDAALAQRREQGHDGGEEQGAEPGGGQSAAKRDADQKAGDAAIARMAAPENDEGGYPEAGEKVGDKGVLTADVRTLVDGRSTTIPKGTEVVVRKVRGEELVVKLPSGGSARISSSQFKVTSGPQGGGGGQTTQPAQPAQPTQPVKPPEPAKPLDPLADPTKNPDPKNEYAQNAEYGEQKGVVAVKGAGEAHEIAPDDVQQGSLGDCYFVAQLAAQAKANPDRIKDLIKDNGDGTYTVTLYLKDPSQPWKRAPKAIVVDSQFPMNNGSVAYAKPGDRGDAGPELWAMLIEKAFAKYSGSYELIRGSKTKDGDVFAMMSGEASSKFSPASVGADALLDRLTKAIAAGRAAYCGAKNKTGLDEKMQEEARAAGVVLNHAYAVEGVDAKAKTISLRNPWGVKHLFNFPVDQVLKFYDTCEIAAK